MKKILIIDDEEELVELLSERLTNEGFQTEHAFDGLQGIKKTLEFQPHLILLDIMMPGMNGWDVCKALRSYHQILGVPIILITALDKVDVRDRAALVGATDILHKPYTDPQLISIVKEHLSINKIMIDSVIADRKPAILILEAGTYQWCTCGRSKNQPYCDGSHKGTEFSPTKFRLEARKKVALCQCKRTKNPPYCDGTHAKI